MQITRNWEATIHGSGLLRKLLHGMDEIGAMGFLLDKMKSTKSNDEFFASMKR